ncbi:MAG: hypothetical protein ACI8P7_001452, partial [Candidatus Azotimanducaceae bacterium]
TKPEPDSNFLRDASELSFANKSCNIENGKVD